jgi:hypothetical protein
VLTHERADAGAIVSRFTGRAYDIQLGGDAASFSARELFSP